MIRIGVPVATQRQVDHVVQEQEPGALNLVGRVETEGNAILFVVVTGSGHDGMDRRGSAEFLPSGGEIERVELQYRQSGIGANGGGVQRCGGGIDHRSVRIPISGSSCRRSERICPARLSVRPEGERISHSKAYTELCIVATKTTLRRHDRGSRGPAK